MAYEFQTSEVDGVFVARVGGERHERVSDNFEELWEFWSSVASAMKHKGLNRLVAVISARGSLRTLNVRTFYRRLSEMGFLAEMRLAIVAEVPTYDLSVLEVGVTTAAQDGWTIRLFTSEHEGMQWVAQSA